MPVANFLSDPAAMRDYAGWSGAANTTSSGTLEEMMRAFRNIVSMTQDVSDKLNRSADEYETREHESTQILSS